MNRVLTWALCLVFALAPWARAQKKENFEKGFSPEKLYHFGTLDNVNLFNGNLIVAIPIGDPYPLGGGSSYALTLSYNSQAWEFAQVTPISQSNPPCCEPWAYPNRRSNAGFGWALSLGRRATVYGTNNNNVSVDMYAYESPDGNEHRLDVSSDLDNATADARSSDGSYLRWRGAAQTLDAPDGSTRTFWPDGTLKRMADAYGNYIDVTETFSNGRLASWHITDNHGRSHWVYFKTFSGTTTITPPGGSSIDNYKTVVDKVTLQTAGGAVSYTFVYADEAGTIDAPSTVKENCRGFAAGYPAEYELPLLRKIELPDGSSYSEMNYITSDKVAYACDEGLLTRLTLPTKGKLAWSYDAWTFPANSCEPGEKWYHTTTGVRTRKFLDANGTTDLGTWTYQNDLTDKASVTCESGSAVIAQTQVTTVTSPSGNEEKSWFTVWPDAVASPNGIYGSEYGHPQSRLHTDLSGTRYLSTQSFDCTDGCPTAPTREKYIHYVADARGSGFPRVTSERRVYEDDTYVDVDRSDFDGFGHFRREEVSGTVPRTVRRTSFTDFNSGTDENGNRDGAFAFPNTEKWILNTFTEQWVKQNGTVTKSLLCFDGATGFLRQKRSFKQTSDDASNIVDNAEDLMAVYIGDHGNVVAEKYYGGSGPNKVAPPAFCGESDAGLPTAEYEIRHTYDKGVLATSQYYDGGTPLSFLSVDRTVHASGMVTSERDTTGLVSTSYGYNNKGQLSTLDVSGLATTNYTYTNANLNGTTLTPAQVTITRGDTSSRFQYDALGRVKTEFRTLPGVGEVRRFISYDIEGRQATVSAWSTSTSPVNATTYSYDAFGRPKSVVAPDGADTTYVYTGVQAVTRTTSIATPANEATPSTTTERYDGFGRLVEVSQDAADTDVDHPEGTTVTTIYGYDVGGRLASATLVPGSQTARTFSYDGRGFLLSETHPENGQTTYGDYDSRGHVGKKTLAGPPNGGAGDDRSLKFTYDKAERLVKVEDATTSTPKLLKEFTFGTTNTNCTLCLGKLTKAVRRNELASAGTIDVTENYGYATLSGLLTSRTTVVEKVANGVRTKIQEFSLDVTPDDLGFPQSVTMPTCSANGCSTSTTANGLATTDYTRANGFLTSVNTFASLTYHPSGMVERVVHQTTPAGSDIYSQANGIPRPSAIQFTSGATCPQITASTITAPAALCPDSTGNSASVPARSGITHRWQITGGVITSSSSGNTITFDVTSTTMVTLTVTATDTCGGTATASKNVSVTSAPSGSTISAPASVCPNSSGHAASVTARTGITYSWQISSGGQITSSTAGTSITFSVGSESSVTLTVTASNACGVGTSTAKSVTITAAPTASTITSPTTVLAGSTLNDASVAARSGITHRWSIAGGTITSSTNGDSIQFTAGESGSVVLTVAAINSCGSETTSTATSRIELRPPTTVSAQTVMNRTVQIAWSAVAGAAQYRVERTTIVNGAASSTQVVNAASTSFTDTAPGSTLPVTYIYYVRALDGAGYASARGAFDDAVAATQLYSQDLASGVAIRAMDIVETRHAIDAQRSAFGLPPAFSSAVAPTGMVRASDITALIDALNAARAAANRPAFVYVNNVSPPAQSRPVMAGHIGQLRESLR